MQYKAAVLAAFAAVATAQMDMPMPEPTPMPMSASGDMPMSTPAAGGDMPMPAAGGDMPMPAASGDMPMSAPAPAMGGMPPAAGGMPAAMGAGMGMGMGMPMAGGRPKFDNTTLTGQCNEIAMLTGFTKFAANDTQVQMAAMMVPLSTEQVAELKANATMAQDQLTQLESNQTLTDTCTKVNSVTVPCRKYAGLMKLEELAQNDTKISMLQMKRNLTDAQVSQLKQFAASQADNLDMMNNNITLVTQCMDLETNKKSGMAPADAALKAFSSALPEDAANAPMTGEKGTASGSMKTTNAASAITMSSLLAAIGVAASLILLA